MIKGKVKKSEFEGQELEIKGLSVYRAICLRGKVKAEDTEDNLNIMADIIAECVVSPAMKKEDILALDLETFRALFDVVANNNGLNMGNEQKPATI
jgi:hypothetical protein